MSLCQHGYTANWDCPFCECPCGSGSAAGECNCIGAPPAPAKQAPLPVSNDELLSQFAELVLTVNAARSIS